MAGVKLCCVLRKDCYQTWLSPRTNERLKRYEREFIKGNTGGEVRVHIELIDGTTYDRPVRYEETSKGLLKIK